MSSTNHPGYTPTILEGATAQDRQISPTVLDAGTGTVLEDGAIISPVGAPLPTESFSGFSAVRRLSTSSTEAEVFLARNPETEEMRVVKWYYNTEHRPAHDVMEKLKTMDLRHIPRLFDHGYSRAGRYFELLEYIEEGSLEDLIAEKIPDENEAKAILREIVEALEHLESQGISHRDLKPENILIRKRNPIDLVIVDFGLARVTGGNLHKTKLGETPLYSPPEGGKIVHRNRDWWSLGIITVKLRMGKHPWEGMDNDQIILDKNTRPAPIPPELGPDWVLLAKGLLTRDPEKRWSAPEVERWLAGECNIPVYFETEIREIDTRPVFKDYDRDLSMYSLEDVARVLATPDWMANERLLARGGFLLSDWVKKIGKPQVATVLDEIIQDSTLPSFGKVAAAIWLFDENDSRELKAKGIICLRGGVMTEQDVPLLFSQPGEFHLNPDESRLFVDESRIGYWQSKLTGRNWWNTLRQRRLALLKLAEDQNVNADLRNAVADVLSIAPEGMAISAALEIKRNFVYSSNPTFNRILQGGDNLSFQDAWLLASADPNRLLNAGSNTRREFDERFRGLSPLLNAYSARNLAGTLLMRSPGAIYILCVTGFTISLLWAEICGKLIHSWISFTICWLVIFPIVGAVLRALIRNRIRKMLQLPKATDPIPSTTDEWAAVIKNRTDESARTLGRTIENEKAARNEWKEALGDCRRVNQRCAPRDQIVSPRSEEGHLKLISIAYPIILVLAALIPPEFHQFSGTTMLGTRFTDPFEHVRSPFDAWIDFWNRPKVADSQSTDRHQTGRANPTDNSPALKGERFPDTRRKLLSYSNVNGLSFGNLQYAINEMFARHGSDFPKSVKRQFEPFGWYHPRPGLSYDQLEQEFSDLEKANLKLLSAVRDSKSPGRH